MTAARGVALSALVLAILLAGYLLLFRGGGGHEYTLRVPDGGPARQGRRRAGRRPADRLRALDRAHGRQPRGRQGQGRGALRAAARGHPRRDPAHLAVGHRQPLRRAHARARHQQAARRRRQPRPVRDDLGGRPRPGLQRDRQEDARRPAGRHQGLRHPVRGQEQGGRPVGQVLQPAAVDLARAGQPGHRGRGRADALPRELLARGDRGRRAPRRPLRPGHATPTRRPARSPTRTWRSRARSSCCRPRCGAPTPRS